VYRYDGYIYGVRIGNAGFLPIKPYCLWNFLVVLSASAGVFIWRTDQVVKREAAPRVESRGFERGEWLR